MLSVSFNAIIPENAKILILGTMPGVKSLEEQQYYAHERNSFWPIMFKIFNEELPVTYKAKVAFLEQKKIALWDTLKLCYREGSLDSNIKDAEPNEIIDLLRKYPTIKNVFFNGKSAEKHHDKFHERQAGISYYSMPSTSPANARLKFVDKYDAWAMIKNHL